MMLTKGEIVFILLWVVTPIAVLVLQSWARLQVPDRQTASVSAPERHTKTASATFNIVESNQ